MDAKPPLRKRAPEDLRRGRQKQPGREKPHRRPGETPGPEGRPAEKNAEDIEYIVAKGNELAPNWMDLLGEFDYPQEDGFYFFERDAATGLNTAVPARRTQPPERPPIYLLSRLIHALVFEPKSPLFKPMPRLMQVIDSSPIGYKIFHWLERWSKSSLYACKDCGDCALFDAAYLCPVSQCPKDQRNAPCGGSYLGWCEVYPGEKRCIWVKAYARLKAQNREDEIGKCLVPPCNWELHQTSSWINYFLGRDHSSKIRGIKPPEPHAKPPKR
jgi:methylenetetrahydrofolate reductase (NADPH)